MTGVRIPSSYSLITAIDFVSEPDLKLTTVFELIATTRFTHYQSGTVISKTNLRRELFSVERSNEIDFELPTRDVLVEGVLK